MFNNVSQAGTINAISINHEQRAVNQAKPNRAIGVFCTPSHGGILHFVI
jgi:hypothetical protein